MKDIIGIVGFILLVLSAVFIDTPFIGVLALLVFLGGSALILIFYLKQIDTKERMNILSQNLIIIGVVLLCAILAAAAVQYNQFQGYLDRNQVLSWNWKKIISVFMINIVASLLIFIGVWKGSNYHFKKLIVYTIPTLLIIPFTLILIKVCVITGIWAGASI